MSLRVSSIDALIAALDRGQDAIEALRALIADDAWLPERLCIQDPPNYRQHLLYRDAAARFTIVGFVWGPGQETQVHDHGVWGLVGVVRGEETSQAYRFVDGACAAVGAPETLHAGEVMVLAPPDDWHRVRNTGTTTAVSIHVYGGDIGVLERRSVGEDGSIGTFVSGYSA